MVILFARYGKRFFKRACKARIRGFEETLSNCICYGKNNFNAKADPEKINQACQRYKTHHQ